MTKQPEALRLADVLIGSPQFTGTPIWQAADHIRRQHEAIQKLRGALTEMRDYIWLTGEYQAMAAKALKDTEDLA